MWLRIIKWAALGITVLLVVFGAVVIYEWLSRRHEERVQAKTWHLDFGDEASIGRRRITLPSDWWAEPIQEDGTIILRNVDESVLNDSELAIIARPLSVSFTSDEEVLDALRPFSQSDSVTPGSLIHFQTHGMNLQCSRRIIIGREFEDLCLAVDFPFQLKCVGRVEHEQECKAVLQTLH